MLSRGLKEEKYLESHFEMIAAGWSEIQNARRDEMGASLKRESRIESVTNIARSIPSDPLT